MHTCLHASFLIGLAPLRLDDCLPYWLIYVDLVLYTGPPYTQVLYYNITLKIVQQGH